MTYQQTVLNDKPVGFWMITAPSGTSETDLSGNAKTATITEATDLIDRSYRPLVTGTSTDIAYRFYSGNHKLTYPALEIWERDREHTSFSIEFTFQPIVSKLRVTLFAPQQTTAADIPDNGIYLENGRLYFSVSNGTPAVPTTRRTVASTYLSTGATYHVVAVYDVNKIYLYINGVLADQQTVDPNILWSHSTANFITFAPSLPADPLVSSFLFDAAAVYRSALSAQSVNNHYVMSTPNIPEVEIVNSLGGKLIKINDEDRTKSLDYSAKENWSSNLNTLTNLVQNDDGSVGLRKIPPLRLSSTADHVNSMTWNQATAETASLTGMGVTFNPGALTNTISKDATQFVSGTQSWKVAFTSGTGVSQFNFGTTPAAYKVPVVAGKTYTAHVWIRCSAAIANSLAISWYNSTGAYLTSSSAGGTVIANTWTERNATGVAPLTATSASIEYTLNPSSGQNVWYDEAGFWEGGSNTWLMPRYDFDKISLNDSSYLTVDNAGTYIGNGAGAFGFFADISTANNDNTNEQVLAAFSSSDSNHILEIVKKTNKSIYLRYTYKSQTGLITVSESVWGAQSSLLDTQPYFYLEWAAGLASLYINSTSSPAVIAFDAGIPEPKFDQTSYLILGAGYEGLRPWNNFFKWLKIYDKQQPTNKFVYNQATVNGFTAKLGSSLNVSQSGTIKMTVPTGSNGSAITQSRIAWEPDMTAISAATTPESTVNLLTLNQASIETDLTGFGSAFNATQARSTARSVHGIGSLAATVTTASFPQTQTLGGLTGTPVLPNTQYTSVASYYIAAAGRTAATYIYWYKADGTASSTPNVGGSGVALSSGVWAQAYVTATSPADAAFAQVRQVITAGSAISDVFYVDKLGLWEGSGTTWTEPYQTVSNSNEILPVSILTTMPDTYYVSATMQTDDSYYNPVKINDIRLTAFSNNNNYAENGWDELKWSARANIKSTDKAIITQPVINGSYVDSNLSDFYIVPVDDSTTVFIPDGGTAVSTAGPAPQIRTLEFWMYPEAEGYYCYYEGAVEYWMRYLNSGGFTTTGFTTLYVDGVATTNGTTSTTWYNRWHHILLTNSSLQILLGSPPAGVNLLSVNQASVETDLTGLGAGTNTTAARSTVTASHGTASLSLTATGAGSIDGGGSSGNPYQIPVITGNTYTGHVASRAATASRSGFAHIDWRDASYAYLSSSNGSSTANSTGAWTSHTVTAVAPANAVFALVRFSATGCGASEVHYADKFGIWAGTSTEWALPGETRVNNILTYNQSTLEINTVGVGNNTNTTWAQDATQALHGTKSAKITVTAGNGTTTGDWGWGLNSTYKKGVVPGTTYTIVGSCFSETTTCNLGMGVWWYDRTGSFIYGSYGTKSTTTANAWVQRTMTIAAPPGAVYAAPFYEVYLDVASAVRYLDCLGMWEGTSTTWTPGGARMKLGMAGPGGAQAIARYQDVSYYPQTFTAPMVTTNYKAYLGDITTGSVTDAPGGRTITEPAQPNPAFYSDLWTIETIKIR